MWCWLLLAPSFAMLQPVSHWPLSSPSPSLVVMWWSHTVTHNTSENSRHFPASMKTTFNFSMLGIFLVRNSSIFSPPTPVPQAQCKAQGCEVALRGLTNSGGVRGGQAAVLHATMSCSTTDCSCLPCLPQWVWGLCSAGIDCFTNDNKMIIMVTITIIVSSGLFISNKWESGAIDGKLCLWFRWR